MGHTANYKDAVMHWWALLAMLFVMFALNVSQPLLA